MMFIQRETLNCSFFQLIHPRWAAFRLQCLWLYSLFHRLHPSITNMYMNWFLVRWTVELNTVRYTTVTKLTSTHANSCMYYSIDIDSIVLYISWLWFGKNRKKKREKTLFKILATSYLSLHTTQPRWWFHFRSGYSRRRSRCPGAFGDDFSSRFERDAETASHQVTDSSGRAATPFLQKQSGTRCYSMLQLHPDWNSIARSRRVLGLRRGIIASAKTASSGCSCIKCKVQYESQRIVSIRANTARSWCQERQAIE